MSRDALKRNHIGYRSDFCTLKVNDGVFNIDYLVPDSDDAIEIEAVYAEGSHINLIDYLDQSLRSDIMEVIEINERITEEIDDE